MKKILFYLGIVALTLGSCSELDQEPVSSVGPDAVFNSQSGLHLYANSFYAILPTASDIVKADNISDFGARKEVPDYFREGAFGPQQSSGWTWDRLRNINYFLENNTSGEVPEEVRNHYNGIARFFRAWFYFEKVKRFGDVPWVSNTIDVKEDDILYAKRDSRVVVMDSILNDLDYAIDNITMNDDDSRSLITRDVAAAFKSRVALFEGTFRKYHTDYGLADTASDLLSQAVAAADFVIAGGGFSINTSGATPYYDLFGSTSPIKSEVILANIYDVELGILHDANWFYTSSTYGNRLNLTRSFVNTYLTLDGTPFTSIANYSRTGFPEETYQRDLRLSQTIRTPGYERVVGGQVVAAPPVFSYTYTGYQPIKWVLPDSFYDTGSNNDNVIPIIRYAEVLLNYAEAKAELGTLSDQEWDMTIGALRRRAGITNGTTTLPTAVDPYLQAEFFPNISDPVLLEVRRERGIELVFEGFRFYDLVRWAKGDLFEKTWNGFYVEALNVPMDLNDDGVNDVLFYQGTPPNQLPGVTYVDVSANIRGDVNPMQLTNGTSGEITWLENIPIVWDDKFYLYPIPENDRLMNPNLGQNPGW